MLHKINNKKLLRTKKKIIVGLVFVIVALAFTLILPNTKYSSKKVSPQKTKSTQRGINFMVERRRLMKLISTTNDMSTFYKEFLASTKDLVAGQQHLLAHVVGELMFDKIGEASIAICDSSYSYGCYHGVSTSAIAEKGLYEVKVLNDECTKKYGTNNSSPCNHGIGHGIMEFFEHRDDKLNAALHACDDIYKEIGAQRHFGCSSGVFMEFNHPIVIKDTTVVMNTRPNSKNEIYYPCTYVEKQFQTSCYHSMAQWWVRSDEGNYKRLGDLCEGVADKTNRTSCYLGIGNIVAPESLFNPELTKERCEQLASIEGQAYCKQAAAILYFDQKDRARKRHIICEGLTSSELENCFGSPPRL